MKDKLVPVTFYIPQSERDLFDRWAKYKGLSKAADIVKTVFYGQIPRVAPERFKTAFDELHFKKIE